MRVLVGCFMGVLNSAAMGQLTVVVDQVGYESRSIKHAVVVGTEQDHPDKFSLVDSATGKTVLTGSLVPNGQVDSWGGRVFWTADFSSWQTTGHYAVQVQSNSGAIRSCPL